MVTADRERFGHRKCLGRRTGDYRKVWGMISRYAETEINYRCRQGIRGKSAEYHSVNRNWEKKV
jgi:hypothetical protein